MVEWWRSGRNFTTLMPTITKPTSLALLADNWRWRKSATRSGDCRSIEQYLRSPGKMEAVESGHRLRTNWKGYAATCIWGRSIHAHRGA